MFGRQQLSTRTSGAVLDAGGRKSSTWITYY